MIDPELLLRWPPMEVRQHLARRDTLFYALSIGLGDEPLDARQLRYVYERGLAAFPTMATVLCYPGPVLKDPRLGIDYTRIVHAEQHLRLHGRLPVEGELRGTSRIVGVADRGAQKGARVHVRREIFDAASGTLLASADSVSLCRADGGFGGTFGESLVPEPMPDGPPDVVVEIATQPNAALLYRLNGDYNPLHADPESAVRAGFERPILHGLCTLGVAARAVLAACCDYDPQGLQAFGARFTAPVMPGEKVRVEIWRRGRTVSFRASIAGRGAKVLDNGHALLGS